MKNLERVIIIFSLLIVIGSLTNLFSRTVPLPTQDEAPIPIAPQTIERFKQASLPTPMLDPEAPADIREESQGKVILKTQVLRGVDEVIHQFYKDGKEIARQTIAKDGTVEEIGKIPDGPVEFIDDFNNIKGETIFLEGKKNGFEKGYYADGKVQSEAFYRNGKLRNYKEFYHDGQIRFEQNWEDARPYPGDKEIGIGKLYYPNGKMKFEWNMTLSTDPGFKKSYNTDGSLRAEFYYDLGGNLIPPKETKAPQLKVITP